MFMYPMCFNEYLEAIGKGMWVESIIQATPNKPLFEALHNELVSAFRTFLLVGGMPASVKAWVDTGDYNECMEELGDIQQSYYDDFPKYNSRIPADLLRNTLQSVITQNGKKFIYSKVAGGYGSEDVKKKAGGNSSGFCGPHPHGHSPPQFYYFTTYTFY